MMQIIKKLLVKYREPITYILVGGGTTAVAWGCKYLWNLFFFGGTLFPNMMQITVLSIVENVAAIAYAYPANRKWVFHSTSPNILEELIKFTGSRVVVWVLGWLLNMLLVSVLGINMLLSTVLVGIIGVNVNFVLSKLLIFRHNRNRTQHHEAQTITLLANAYDDAEIAPAA